MSQDALSGAQFGQQQGPSSTVYQQPPSADTDQVPLAYSEHTNSTVKTAAAWRKPARTLPLGQGTSGSLFRPFDN